MGCGITHTGIVAIDVVKCRKQVAHDLYKSIGQGLTKIRAEEGLRGLTLGWAPTAIGYSLQGLGKFGFYEIFKDVYKAIVGEENADRYKKIGWSISSASAEVIADVLLCPWEAMKVRMQTTLPPGTFPTSLKPAFDLIHKNEGVNGFYKGLAPLWARQVPYTVVKFVAFEEFVGLFYRHIFTQPKETYGKPTQLGVSFLSGYAAGVFCAIVSHPADTMVSQLNKKKTTAGVGAAVAEIYKEIGFNGLWRGLGARIIMVGTLTGFQWWIYDTWKTFCGLQTTGGGPKKH